MKDEERAATAREKDDLPFYLFRQQGFSTAKPEDDLLHPQYTGIVAADSLTETQFFSFMVPEDAVFGLGYLLHHPNLKSLVGGVWVWRGFKRHALACEIFDLRAFTHERVLAGDLWDFRLDNGYGVRIMDPLKRYHLTYSDPARGNEIDLHFEAIIPPVMFDDGKHFEQPVAATGTLRLRGERYAIDCRTIRDRSWGKPRPELSLSIPPISWNTVVFNDDFAINCNAMDHPDLSPDYAGIFNVPESEILKGGWIYRDNELRLIVECRKRTRRHSETMQPLEIDMDLIDDHDARYSLKGVVTAASDCTPWPNLRWVVGMTRWECNGTIAYGETQEPHFGDYLIAKMRV